MLTRDRSTNRDHLIAVALALPIVLSFLSSGALAAVSLSDAPAERAEAVSGVSPVLTQPSDMTLGVGETADQTLHATDGDGEPLTFVKTAGPEYMTVSTTDPGTGVATGNIHLAPDSADAGVVNAIVTASDGTLFSSRTFRINAQGSPAAPVLSQPQDMTIDAGETQTQELYASDANGDPLTFSMVSGPAYMTVTTVDSANGIGNIRLAPDSTDVGSAIGEVRVTDGALADQKTFGIAVGVGVAPYLYPPYSMSVQAGSTADQTLYATDDDGDSLTFSKVSGPAYMTVTTTNPYPGGGYAYGNLHLAPAAGDVGDTSGTVRVSDGILFADGYLGITVLGGNRPPVLIQPADMSVTVGEVGEQTVTATDPDNDYIEIFKASGPAYLTVIGYGSYGSATATIRVTPGTGDAGMATAAITAYDYYNGLSDTKSFSVTVQAGDFPAACPAGSFSSMTMPVGYGLIEVQTADLNGDGALDLVAELPDQQRVAVFLGAGDGSFAANPIDLTSGFGPASGAIADLDGDDVPDLAIANSYSSNVSVFLGDGSGGFGPKQDFPAGSGPRSIAIADMNRDGKPDLLVTNPGSNSVSLLRGVGGGAFGAATSIAAGYSAWQLAVADLNRDGAPDLIVTNAGDNDISVFRNNGIGGLGSRTDYPVGFGPVGLAAGDLNGDGNADVVVACGDSDYLSVFLGNGDGSLGARRNFPTNRRPSLLAITDLNGDAIPDVASANLYSNDVSILLGDGAGALAPRTDIPASSGPYGIAAGDFDDDLRTDLVVANYFGGSLSLLMNGCAPLRDHPPVVQAPNKITSGEGNPISFAITANDPDGPAISSLTASFAALPLGHNATFAANASNTGGTFSWTPTFQDARPTAYLVTFTATNVLSDTAGTKITVTNVNRGPSANAGGPYTAFAGSALTLNGTGSSDPDGDALTFNWIYGDGSTGTGMSPVHTYAAVGLYGIALTVSDASLSAIATTTATIVGVLQARAFTASGNRTIRLSAGKPQWCANIEPVGRSYSNVAVDLTTLVMKSAGTGSVSQIRAITDKVSIAGDHDGNGVEEITTCFTKTDLRLLFSDLHGTNAVTVTIEGSLFAGGIFRAQMDVSVIASGGQLAASVSPNPLNPDAILTFTTAKPGFASVDLFDLRGRLVRRLLEEQALSPGYHDVRIDGRDGHGERLASGVYFFRIHAAEGEQTGQLTVLK